MHIEILYLNMLAISHWTEQYARRQILAQQMEHKGAVECCLTKTAILGGVAAHEFQEILVLIIIARLGYICGIYAP